MHEAFREGLVTPTDVAKAFAERIGNVNHAVQAWVGFDEAKMYSAARASEVHLVSGQPMRLLEGIPVGVKDIFNTIDFPTEMGSPQWKDFTPGNDSRMVFNLKRSGACVAGKTVTAEFAVHELNETLNPHDSKLTPGTSSSGSAAAVATGMVPIALGSQTAASIIRPASFCGVYGMKPSYGVMPRTGVLKTTDTLDTIGFFVRHMEDMERTFNALRVHGEDYPFINSILENPAKQKINPDGPWKIGFVKTHTWDFAEPYAKAAITDWVEELKSTSNDLVVEDVSLPVMMNKSHEVHETLYNKCLAYYFQSEFDSKDQMSETMYRLIEKGLEVTPAQYKGALAEQTRMIDEMDGFMANYDALICLSTAGAAPQRGEVENRDPGLMWTLTHMPAVNLPVFADSRGMPFGAQIVARKYRDIGLIRFLQSLRSLNMVPAEANVVEALR
ncbi:amidase [Thalassospira sp. MCCC 1A01148]|nr:amidase [Thalassospira sp. MCCC 1A01148]